MKKTILILCCLILTTAVVWAKDYQLVETQMLDSEIVDGRLLTVYVLLFPDDTRPKVFKTFASKEMEGWLSGLPRGTVVHYDANKFLPAVDSAKIEALKASCQKKSVSFVEDSGG